MGRQGDPGLESWIRRISSPQALTLDRISCLIAVKYDISDRYMALSFFYRNYRARRSQIDAPVLIMKFGISRSIISGQHLAAKGAQNIISYALLKLKNA